MSNRKLSFIITFLYVFVGTLYALIHMNNPGWGKGLEDVINDIFLPASFFMELIMFVEKNAFLYVLISQTIVFFLLWAIVYLVVSVFRKDPIKSD